LLCPVPLRFYQKQHRQDVSRRRQARSLGSRSSQRTAGWCCRLEGTAEALHPLMLLARCRLPVVPTVTVLGMIKIRLTAAKKGHQLLKKKVRRRSRCGQASTVLWRLWASRASARRLAGCR
jgi:hypothetical protein